MINFRFHIVSLVAVFLALGVGVIMGTAVIDSAVVDRLEAQQRGLESRIEDVTSENGDLRRELRALESIDQDLAADGGPLLLRDELADVPVVLVTVKGIAEGPVRGLLDQLDAAGADVVAVVRLDGRLGVDGDDGDAADDLAEALGLPADTSAATLRATAITRLATALRGSTGTDSAARVLAPLRAMDFLELEDGDGDELDQIPVVPVGSVVAVVTDLDADLSLVQGTLPLVRALVRAREDGLRPATVLVAEPTPQAEPDGPGDGSGGLVQAV
ncbi:MAG: copper transporter, partial [Acidimicrobiia bacterium]